MPFPEYSPLSRANSLVLGAVAGDVIGSPYEWNNIKTTRFPLFRASSRITDDSVLTWATMSVLLGDEPRDYARAYHKFGHLFPMAGYGPLFYAWLGSDSRQPYQSWGNGAAMRVSPIGMADE